MKLKCRIQKPGVSSIKNTMIQPDEYYIWAIVWKELGEYGDEFEYEKVFPDKEGFQFQLFTSRLFLLWDRPGFDLIRYLDLHEAFNIEDVDLISKFWLYKIISQDFDKRLRAKEKINEIKPQLIECLEYLKEHETSKRETNIKGFSSILTDKQIQTLFTALKGNFIAENTNESHFKAIFRNEALPDGVFINWIDKHTNEIDFNKHSLFDFLHKNFPELKTPEHYVFIQRYFTIGGKRPSKDQLKSSYSAWNKKNLKK